MRAWSLTDQGRVRSQNQDACSFLQFTLGDGTEVLAAVVCDGMGGEDLGEEASLISVDTLAEFAPALKNSLQILKKFSIHLLLSICIRKHLCLQVFI